MQISLNFRSDTPIYTQIVEQVQEQVTSGILKPGDQLPTVRAMATELRINFNTVARAYRILDDAGVISTQQGRGTFILDIPPPETSAKIHHELLEIQAIRYLNEARRMGFTKEQAIEIFQKTAQTWQEENLQKENDQ